MKNDTPKDYLNENALAGDTPKSYAALSPPAGPITAQPSSMARPSGTAGPQSGSGVGLDLNAGLADVIQSLYDRITYLEQSTLGRETQTRTAGGIPGFNTTGEPYVSGTVWATGSLRYDEGDQLFIQGANSTQPVPDGWLVCNGSWVPRASYPELFTKIGMRPVGASPAPLDELISQCFRLPALGSAGVTQTGRWLIRT